MTFPLRTCVVAMLAGTLAALAPAAHAQAQPAAPEAVPAAPAAEAKAPSFPIYSLGLAVGASPRYPGSDRTQVGYGPLVDVQFSNGLGFGQRGISWDLKRAFGGREENPDILREYRQPLTYGVFLSYEGGREDKDDDNKTGGKELAGMGRLEGSTFAGGYFGGEVAGFGLSVSARKGLSGGNRGAYVELAASHDLWAYKEIVMFSADLQVELADRKAMQAWHGVTAEQSARSGYAAYAPGGGLRSARVMLNAVAPLGEEVTLVLTGGYERLLGDAADSPLTRRAGSGTGSAVLVWRF